MQRVDWVLLGLGVAVLVAAGVGVAGSDRWTGERDVDYRSGETALEAQGPAEVGGTGARFEWSVPDNATAARLRVSVSFTGQAIQGGPATVHVQVTMPDGSQAPAEVGSLPIPAGGTSAALELDVDAAWADVPRDGADVHGKEPAARVWAQPLVVTVTVARPSDAPLATYAFSASASGLVSVYEAFES